MIIVNVYYEEDYNPATDGYHLILAGVINDQLDLDVDPELIKNAIDRIIEKKYDIDYGWVTPLVRM